MTKNPDFQKELLEKVKPGTKPSHLKRSKSADDIPKAPSLPLNQLTELKKQTDLNSLLQEQLKEKQKEIEALRQKDEDSAKQIEELRKQLGEPKETLTELDHSLMARHQSLKD